MVFEAPVAPKASQNRLWVAFLKLGSLWLSVLQAKASLGWACRKLKASLESAKWRPRPPELARPEQPRLVAAIQVSKHLISSTLSIYEIYLSIYLSISIYLYIYLPIYLSIYLAIYPSVYL